PSCASTGSAWRTGVRDMPSRSASGASATRSPGPSSPRRIISRIRTTARVWGPCILGSGPARRAWAVACVGAAVGRRLGGGWGGASRRGCGAMGARGALGPGERVAEAPLAERLGMSRTPVRQALPVLAQEGLLTEHQTRGYVVRGFSTADVLDAIDLRGVLEGLAARRVAERGVSRTLLQALRVCLAEGDQILAEGHVADKFEALYVDMNVRFHQLIVAECRSPIIQQALERNARIPFAGPQALALDKTSLERMYDTMAYAHRQH